MGGRSSSPPPPPPTPERQFETQARYTGPGLAGVKGGLTRPAPQVAASATAPARTAAADQLKGIFTTKRGGGGPTVPGSSQQRN